MVLFLVNFPNLIILTYSHISTYNLLKIVMHKMSVIDKIFWIFIMPAKVWEIFKKNYLFLSILIHKNFLIFLL